MDADESSKPVTPGQPETEEGVEEVESDSEPQAPPFEPVDGDDEGEVVADISEEDGNQNNDDNAANDDEIEDVKNDQAKTQALDNESAEDEEAEGAVPEKDVVSVDEKGQEEIKDETENDENVEGDDELPEHAAESETDAAPVPDEEEEEMEIDESENNEEAEDQDNEESGSAEGGVMTRKRTLSHSSVDEGPKRKVGRSWTMQNVNRPGPAANTGSSKHDKFCWVCHKEGVQVNCKLCPRSYHSKCMSLDYPNAKVGEGDSTCPCPECVVVMNAETLELRSDAMKQLTLDQLMGLLKNICLRMRQTPGSEPFIHPVDPNDTEDYFDFVIYPMDIETLEKNIKKRLYGSTEGFLADAQWLVHNSIVFNSASSQYTVVAKRILKVCKAELAEIETCPECYTNAHEKPDTWFTEACRRPHLLVWAKLKGFPFWPAKAMKIKDNDVDVRFFGQHDRAWVSMKDCFLYSEEMPVAPPKKNGPLLSAIEELTAHVEKLKEKHGEVIFFPARTPIGPKLSVDQIRRMLPEYSPPEMEQSTSHSGSKSSGSSSNNNNNNNNSSSNNKPAPTQPAKKSPMTIRISSLKTNPTIVNISAMVADSNSTGGTSQNEGRVQTRLTRKSSAAAAQSIQNQSTTQSTPATSESEQSNEEEKSAPVDDNKEKEEEIEQPATIQPESVPEAKSEPEDEAPSVPKGSEILASALGGGAVRRSTRGMSRSGDSNAAASETTTTQSLTPTLEKRLTRGAIKSGTPADTGYEADSNGDQTSDEQPPEAVLEAMGLSKKTKETPQANPSAVVVKGEITDHDESEESGMDHMTKSTTSNAIMEQLSSHASIKPGYRFNLSKDISISAVDGAGGGGGGGEVEEKSHFVGMNGGKGGQRRLIPAGHRLGPQGVTVGPGGNLRPRVPVNMSANLVNGQPPQKLYTGPQLRQMVRNARPQHILNPRTGQTVRVAGVNPNRPMTMLTVRGQQQGISTLQKTSKDGALVVDSSTLNPVQGPITLPGGTITVTPLTSGLGNAIPGYEGDGSPTSQQQVTVALKSGSSSSNVLSVQAQQGGSSAINTSIVKSLKQHISSPNVSGATAQQRRQLMVSIPPSVNMHLQNLTKTMGDLVKSTVEQITLEIVEFCNSNQGKAENSRLQLEVERLQNKLKQEVTDVKHNNDIAMRELRMTMENDKKRALSELKRQMELEKQKAIEETKKKQWCANCGREALFYCCWNTSYCGYNCQEDHWPTHMSSCSQGSTGSSR